MSKDITYVGGSRVVKSSNSYTGDLPYRAQPAKVYNTATSTLYSEDMDRNLLGEILDSDGTVIEAISVGPSSGSIIHDKNSIIYTIPHDEFVVFVVDVSESSYEHDLKAVVVKDGPSGISVTEHDIPFKNEDGDIESSRPYGAGLAEHYIFEDGVILGFREWRRINGYHVTGRTYAFIGKNGEFAIHEVFQEGFGSVVSNGIDDFSNITVTPYGIVQVRLLSSSTSSPPVISVTMITREGALVAHEIDMANSLGQLTPTSFVQGESLWGVIWQEKALKVFTPIVSSTGSPQSAVITLPLYTRDINAGTIVPTAMRHDNSGEYGILGGSSRLTGFHVDWFSHNRISLTFSRTELIVIAPERDEFGGFGTVKYKFSDIAEDIIPDGWVDRTSLYGASCSITKEGIYVTIPLTKASENYIKPLTFLLSKDQVRDVLLERMPKPTTLSGSTAEQVFETLLTDWASNSRSSMLSRASIVKGGLYSDTYVTMQGSLSADAVIANSVSALNVAPVLKISESNGSISFSRHLSDEVWKNFMWVKNSAKLNFSNTNLDRDIRYLESGTTSVAVYMIAGTKAFTSAGFVAGKIGEGLLVGAPKELGSKDPYLEETTYKLRTLHPEAENRFTHLFELDGIPHILHGYANLRGQGAGSGSFEIYRWDANEWRSVVSKSLTGAGHRETYVSQYNYGTAMFSLDDSGCYVYNPEGNELVLLEDVSLKIPLASVGERALLVSEDLSEVQLINIQNSVVLENVEMDTGEFEEMTKVGVIAEGPSLRPTKLYAVFTSVDYLAGSWLRSRKVRVVEVSMNG